MRLKRIKPKIASKGKHNVMRKKSPFGKKARKSNMAAAMSQLGVGN